MSDRDPALVHVRTPTYRRPALLERSLASLRAQTWPNWVCDVFDDDPDESGRAVCAALGDARIRYVANRPQKFASANIDQCFSTRNPHEADYFCVLEDDNHLLPDFLADNIARARAAGCEVVLRNQLIERAAGTDEARLDTVGVLDDQFVDGLYAPDAFRLALIAGIGVSNGGLFWSRRAISPLEIGHACGATAQEYMRTFSLREPILVVMEPAAVWADNGVQTTRDLGDRAGWFRREIDLKRRIRTLQRLAWLQAAPALRRSYPTSDRFAAPPEARVEGLLKALLPAPAGATVTLRRRLALRARGLLIRTVGRLDDDFRAFLKDRAAPPAGRAAV